MLPARSHAALRARRCARCWRAIRPTVIAATVGANTAPNTAMIVSAASTTGMVGRLDDGDGSDRQCPYPTDQERPLVRRRIDEDADRGVQRDPDQPARGQHQADRGLVPVRLPEQEDADIRPQPAAHVGEQEIDQVEAVAKGIRPAYASPSTRRTLLDLPRPTRRPPPPRAEPGYRIPFDSPAAEGVQRVERAAVRHVVDFLGPDHSDGAPAAREPR